MRRWGQTALFCVLLNLFYPLSLAKAETLADIDAEIQANRTIKADRGGLDAYNIYEGVTNSRLDRKITILQSSGVSPWFYKSGTGTTNYTNFYSFTSLPGVTDTALDLVTTTSVQRLYRRGKTSVMETSGRLGAWWSSAYRGIETTRNDLAVLSSWGSDLQRIYVIDMPAGYTLIGGVASPMEKDGEYRAGGAYQYYFNGALQNWVVYALYAPDYLKSYSGSVTSAQRLGQSIAADLGFHMNQTRYQSSSGQMPVLDTSGDFWLSGYADNVELTELDGVAANSQTTGMSIGWQRLAYGGRRGEKSKLYVGLMFGRGNNNQKYVSGVENKTQTAIGGVYGLYMNDPEGARSWYGSASFLYGGLDFNNSALGETTGTGFSQNYLGNIALLTLENGVSFRQSHGWTLEPQVQFSYAKVILRDFTDRMGALITLRQGEAFWGRAGIEARRTIAHKGNRQSRYWGRLSFSHRFSPGNEVDVSGDRAFSEMEKNRFVLAVGADLQMSRKCFLQGEASRVFGGEKGFQGNLALKYVW